MSAFSPSPQFAKRWLATPVAVKESFRQELDDIIDMLHSPIPARDFNFSLPDFGEEIKHLMATHKDESKPVKLIHSLDTSLTPIEPRKPALSNKEIQELEVKICDKLSAQITDFLDEHMGQLSDDLKAWIKTAVKNELAEYK